MKRRIPHFLSLAATLIALNTGAQEVFEDQAAQEIIPNTVLLRTSKYSDQPSFVRFKKDKQLPVTLFREWLTSSFDFSSKMDFRILDVKKDKVGFTHTRLRQTYNGHDIEGATLLTHAKLNKIVSFNGLFFSDLTTNLSASISESAALEEAQNYVGATLYKWDVPAEEAHLKWESGDSTATYYPEGELVYVPKDFNFGKENYRLAYKFNIYAHAPISRAYIYVDAQTGEVLAENSILHHVDTPGTAETAYSGTQNIIADSFGTEFRLRDGSRGLGIRTFDLNNAYGYGGAVDFVDDDNDWNNVNPQQDEYAGDAHWGTEMCYDYFNDEHGRNSIDGAGYQLNSYVHYGVNYVNAFWDGTRMTYGDGNGAPYTPLTSLDIAGHEITHGLTNFTANLIYFAESGALNESFSDIFGTAIENYARPGDWDWLLSEDIGASFRSLQNPNAYGHPDTYFGTNWAPLAGPDNGGVHSNSGVQNHWYYLLVEGGTGVNDNGDAFTVSAIGFESASAIAFRNLTVYLTDGSDHADARFYGIQSAIDLFGECSFEEVQTTNAWYAVGVGDEYVSSVTADFSATDGCFPEGTVNFSDLSTTLVGAIDTWDWDFGDGGVSTEENPSHDFTGTGIYPVTLVATNDFGCENIFSLDVEVFENPTVDFTVTNLCEDDLTEFTDASTSVGTITGLEWHFGDAGTGAGAVTTHTYADWDTYDVKLVATDDNGCVDSVTLPVDISASPEVIFSSVDDCFEEATVFTNTSNVPDGGTIADYSWDFGDGSLPDATVEPTHTYAGSGTYDVTLSATSVAGCTNSVTNTITRYANPTGDFTASAGCFPEGTVDFSDISTTTDGVIDTWEWDFGDGGVSSDANPSHDFAAAGTYTATLTVTSDLGCEGTIFNDITVFENPTVDFTVANLCEGDLTTFTDASTSPGTITSLDWDFGDAATATGASVTHTYADWDNYNVKLVATDDNGCSDSTTLPVSISSTPEVSFSSDDDCFDEATIFTNATSAPDGGTISDYAWDFGDGSPADLTEEPTHTYAGPGTYDVTLTATSAAGCTNSVTNMITRFAVPIADFVATAGCFPDGTVNFTDLSSSTDGAINTWDWIFGDGSVSTDENPAHDYPSEGTYTTSLTVTSDIGCDATFTSDVEVFENPTVDFSVTEICDGDLSTFTSESTVGGGATITTLDWDFGDATTGSGDVTTHTYAGWGTYEVKLVATLDNGCLDSTTVPISISAIPDVDFSVEDGCLDAEANFINETTMADGETISDYAWNFGDGTPIDPAESPSHLYDDAGTYNVTLVATSEAGCTNSITQMVTRYQLPDANFTVNDLCLGSDAAFASTSTVDLPDIITDHEWDFGDGDTGSGDSPTHSYDDEGTYDVVLTVTSANGCTDEITLPINVFPNPVANFSAISKCINEGAIDYDDLSTITSGTIVGWEWNFGDGGVSSASDPSHSFDAPGDFDTELTVISNEGCENSVTIPVTVYEIPSINFTSDVVAICSPDCIQFTDLTTSSSSDLSSWKWQVEGGDIYTEQNPRICFGAVYGEQLYDVTLIVGNELSCYDTLTVDDFVSVTATPVADFSYTPDEISVFDPSVEFTNLSEEANNYEWNFGDNSSLSNDSDPDHLFPNTPGEYNIRLQATSANGLCSDFIEKTLTIKDVLIYYMPNAFTPDGDLFNQTFSPVFYSGFDPYDFHLTIYNRWGEIVFESFNATEGWDGHYGSEGLVEAGVYIWHLDFKDSQSDKRYTEMGHVSVVQ